jgi:two-component system sensor kinase FixL
MTTDSEPRIARASLRRRATLPSKDRWRSVEGDMRELRSVMESSRKCQMAAHTAAAIAHELNQPLLAISSYAAASLMLLKAENPDFARLRHAIEETERQAQRAAASVRELLSVVKMDNIPTDVFDLNQEIMDILAMAKTDHGLAVRTEAQLSPGTLMVRANRAHVQKVLLNLLRNGAEAMQLAGVPMPAITITVSAPKDRSVAQLAVQDNGPGIRQEDLGRVFEPFFTTKRNGIGMGLCISRSLIEANGGQLWVNPEAGPGASFHLTLRCVDEKRESRCPSLMTTG